MIALVLRACLVAVALTAAAISVNAQSLTQGGPLVAGHLPMYVVSGSTPQVMDSGAANGLSAVGTAAGAGLSELLQVNRGLPGTGTGPLGTHLSLHDASISNPMTGISQGYHALSLDANANGGGLIDYEAIGGASQLPLHICTNGTCVQFPFSTSGIVGPSTTVVGNIPAWGNTVGTLLKNSSTTDDGTVVHFTEPLSFINQTVVPPANTLFGTPGLLVTTAKPNDGIVGVAVQNEPPSTPNFPTGTTGVGILVPGSTGNQAFGGYFESDLADQGLVRGAEIDCMSYVAVQSTRLCNGLLVGAGGQFAGDYGIIVGGGAGGVYNGGTAQRWTTGIYVGEVTNSNHGSTNTWGTYIDGDTTGPTFGMNINSAGGNINLQLTTIDAETVPARAVMQIVDNTDAVHFALRQDGKLVLRGTAHPTVSACGTSPSAHNSNDQAGIITAGTGTVTSCQVNFATAFNGVPSCVISEEAGMPLLWITNAGPTLLMVSSRDGVSNMAGFNFTYHCFDQYP